MANLDPLERGIQRDILLKALIESGVTSQTLTYLLGVDPDTLSASLLRSTTKGSMHTVPGPDWYTSQKENYVLTPYAFYDTSVLQVFESFTIPSPSRWLLVMNADEGSFTVPFPTLTLTLGYEGTNRRTILHFSYLQQVTDFYPVFLPSCVLTPSIPAIAGGGLVRLFSYLMRLPVGQ